MLYVSIDSSKIERRIKEVSGEEPYIQCWNYLDGNRELDF